MKIPGKRIVSFAGAAACAAMMAYALFAQHQMQLEPCPLCILQRIAVVGLGVVLLLAGLHNPQGWGRYVYGGLLAVAAAFGIAVAGRHVWLQSLPPDEVPACGPGLDYMWENFPFAQVIDMVFKGSGECANVDWQFLGLSMPAWVLVAVVGIGAVGTWNILRREPQLPR
jgi:disulfide bond formation protein DsbB